MTNGISTAYYRSTDDIEQAKKEAMAEGIFLR
jgi:hypothetical protein